MLLTLRLPLLLLHTPTQTHMQIQDMASMCLLALHPSKGLAVNLLYEPLFVSPILLQYTQIILQGRITRTPFRRVQNGYNVESTTFSCAFERLAMGGSDGQ